MMKRWSGMGLVFGVAVALYGCESHPTEPEADPSVEAAANEATNLTFQGTGQFYAPAAPPSFRLVSRGTGSSENQTFQMGRMNAGRPEVGKYPLGLGTEIKAHFSRTVNNGGTYEAFATSSGELEITVSRSDRIEGRFRISGFRFCQREQQSGSRTGVACTAPVADDPSAPKIEVSGTFVAVPGS